MPTREKQRSNKHLKRAVEIFGSQNALAKQIGVTQPHIWKLLNSDLKISGDIAASIEKATKGKVTREQLRPEVFGVLEYETSE